MLNIRLKEELMLAQDTLETQDYSLQRIISEKKHIE
jgi:hypothetical protein